MTVKELAIINEGKYQRILMLKIKGDTFILGEGYKQYYDNFNQIPPKDWGLLSKDYFLLDEEGMKEIIYTDEIDKTNFLGTTLVIVC